MYIIKYRGFLQTVTRVFKTRERAEQWLKQIGRSDLINKIERV